MTMNGWPWVASTLCITVAPIALCVVACIDAQDAPERGISAARLDEAAVAEASTPPSRTLAEAAQPSLGLDELPEIHRADVHRCFLAERARQDLPWLTGTVALEVHVDGEGLVRHANIDSLTYAYRDRDGRALQVPEPQLGSLDQCVRQASASWRLPVDHDGVLTHTVDIGSVE